MIIKHILRIIKNNFIEFSLIRVLNLKLKNNKINLIPKGRIN